MEREILFRGKRISDNEWVYGGIAIAQDESVIILTKEEQIVWNVIPETVGQFTGLTDKNGVKIFEGDILKVAQNLIGNINYVNKNDNINGDEISCSFHYSIKKHNKNIPMDYYLTENCYVIGNIHDNHELL